MNVNMSTRSNQGANDQNPHIGAMSDTNSSTPERPLLEVRGLNAGYGETQVLWDISLDVLHGEVVALVGANGAGKSTLLTTISGLLPSWTVPLSMITPAVAGCAAGAVGLLGLAGISWFGERPRGLAGQASPRVRQGKQIKQLVIGQPGHADDLHFRLRLLQ